MEATRRLRKLWWRETKVSWGMRVARFLGRSRKLAFFAGAVALFGGARQLRRRSAVSH